MPSTITLWAYDGRLLQPEGIYLAGGKMVLIDV